MNNIEKGGMNHEEFKIPPEGEKASDEETQESDNQEIDEGKKKVTRRNFLKFVGGVAATVIAPELISGQDLEKNKVHNEEKKDPRKEAEIKSLLLLYQQAKKDTDINRKNDRLDNIGERMWHGNISIDDLGIENLQDKKIREFKKSFAFQVSQTSPELQRKGLDILYQRMKDAGLDWSDLHPESEHNESIMRLLPMEDQIKQAFWFQYNKNEEKIETIALNKNMNALIREDKDKREFLDLYYYCKNRFKVIHSDDRGLNNEEATAINNFRGFFANMHANLVVIAKKRYSIDKEQDKELYEYVNTLSTDEPVKKDKK